MPDNFVVHIVDDDEAVRQSLAFMLSTAGIPVRLYESATAFLSALGGVQDGCLITDVCMPEMTGVELLRELKSQSIAIPAIVITGQGDIALAVEAMKAGAIDFIEKPFEEAVILASVRAAEVRVASKGMEAETGAAVAARLATLSVREKQVLDGVVAGKPNKIIARELDISPRTVEVYRANLMAKMEANSLSELVRMALLANHFPPT
jgi:two-component system, LuxR family, response regulator FixJ